MGCATSLVKYIVFLFNLAFVLLAIAFIAVGVVVKLDIGEITDHVNNTSNLNLAVAPVLLIVVGCLIFVVAFLGCCGAVRESNCMLITYAIILLILFIVQIALGVYAFLLFKDSDTDIKKDIKKELLDVLGKYKTDEDVRKVIDTWQEEKECCGVNGPEDWDPLEVPKTCCANQDVCNRENAYQKGCFDPFYDFLQTSVKVIGILFVVIAGIELVGAIFAFCVASSIRRNERRGLYA